MIPRAGKSRSPSGADHMSKPARLVRHAGMTRNRAVAVTVVILQVMTSSPSGVDVALAQYAFSKYDTDRFNYMNRRSGTFQNASDRFAA